jgi:hypothetical protein
MKNQTIFRLAAFCLIAAFAFCQPVAAQHRGLADPHRLSLENVTAKADTIFVGTIDHLAPAAGMDANSAAFGPEIHVSQVLRGSLASSAVVPMRDVRAINIPLEPARAGQSYIFFALADDDSSRAYFLLKRMPATDATLAKVRDLMANPPDSP